MLLAHAMEKGVGETKLQVQFHRGTWLYLCSESIRNESGLEKALKMMQNEFKILDHYSNPNKEVPQKIPKQI